MAISHRLRLAVLVIVTSPLFGSLATAGSEKLDICHVPPGNPEKAQALRVGERAAAAHLAHGDSQLGVCTVGVGVCAVEAEWICEPGGAVCPVQPTDPPAEVEVNFFFGNTCGDGLDNDCDGLSDEADPDCEISCACTRFGNATEFIYWDNRFDAAVCDTDGDSLRMVCGDPGCDDASPILLIDRDAAECVMSIDDTGSGSNFNLTDDEIDECFDALSAIARTDGAAEVGDACD